MTVKSTERKDAENMNSEEIGSEIRETMTITENAESQNQATRQEVLKEKAESRKKSLENTNEYRKKLVRDEAIDAAIQSGHIIEARILGVEVIRSLEIETVFVTARTSENNGFDLMLIPFNELITGNVLDMSTVDLHTFEGRAEYRKRQQQIAGKFIGAVVPVILQKIIPDPEHPQKRIVIASRRAAAERIRRQAFIENNRHKDGEICEGTLVNVGAHSILLNFDGKDIVIPQRDMTFRFLPMLTDYYQVNDKVTFVMKKLTVEGDEISFTPGLKDAELIKTSKLMKEQTIIREDARARGIITSIRSAKEGKRLTISLWMPDYELPAYATDVLPQWMGREPRFADEVILSVTNVLENKGLVKAKILKVLSNRQMFEK